MSTPVTHCCTSSLSKEITGKKKGGKTNSIFFYSASSNFPRLSLRSEAEKRMTTLLMQLARNETRRDVSRL